MTAQLSDGLDTLLTRTRIAEALTSAGYPTSPATLATKVTRGGGPPYRMYGPRALYRWGDALEWAQIRTRQAMPNAGATDYRRGY